jgi:hypothetical protein
MVKEGWKTFMKPEEKLARRLLERHGLEPPYDLDELASLYADVEYLSFPVKADGIAINIASGSKSQILVNCDSAKVRQKFTLAHELGHIVIPWHTGVIISHTDAEKNLDLFWEYREIEAEANRFAAELLMPSPWVEKIHEKTKNFSRSIDEIRKASGTSVDAVLIKFFNAIHGDGIVCAQLSDAGICEKLYQTSAAPSYISDINRSDVADDNPFSTSSYSEIVALGRKRYRVWYFPNTHQEIVETDGRAWRELLDEVLNETNLIDKKQNVNGIFAAAFNKHKNDVEAVIVRKILSAFDGRAWLYSIRTHPLFCQYVLKKTKELVARKK